MKSSAAPSATQVSVMPLRSQSSRLSVRTVSSATLPVRMRVSYTLISRATLARSSRSRLASARSSWRSTS